MSAAFHMEWYPFSVLCSRTRESSGRKAESLARRPKSHDFGYNALPPFSHESTLNMYME